MDAIDTDGLAPRDNARVEGADVPVVGSNEAFVRAMIEDLEPDFAENARAGPGRPRILPSLALWGGVLMMVLHRETSQQALWRRLCADGDGLWFYGRIGVSDEAVYKRRESGGAEPMERLFRQVRERLSGRLAPYAATDLAPFATEVMALDNTTLDAVTRRLPMPRDAEVGDARLLPGRLAALFDLRLQQWHTVQYVPDPHQNEKVTARSLAFGLPKGSLLLGDLGFYGFKWFDDLTDAGYHWISRFRAKTSYSVLHTSYQDGDTFDGLIWLGAYRADLAKHAVRLVRFRVGETVHSYITNVTDPDLLTMKGIAQLYARRWDIELAVLLLKRRLNLHLLWSSKPVVILQQVWAVLTIAQIVQAMRMEIAGRAGVDPFEVSMALLVEYLPRYARTGADPVAAFVARGRLAGFIRPSTRTIIHAPHIPPDAIVPCPSDLARVRTPRYAERRCAPHAPHHPSPAPSKRSPAN